MSAKKKIIERNLLKNYFEELNHPNYLKMMKTESNQKHKTKKIYLNCETKDNINRDKNNNKSKSNKKSFSLYKNYVEKNQINLYTKYASSSKKKKNRKIVLNCEDKIKTKLNFFKEFKTAKKILSNGSTRKSSDASPNEGLHMQDIANFKKGYPNSNWQLNKMNYFPTKNSKEKNKKNNNNYISLKKNIINLNLNNSHSKSKEKYDIKKNRKSIEQIATNINVNQNMLLQFCHNTNTKEKKEISHNSMCQKPVPTLKLFDCDVSSSSDDNEEEEEEEDKESDEIKYKNVGDHRMETELILDGNFKISDDELSDELNECDAEKKNKKTGILENKLKQIKSQNIQNLEDNNKNTSANKLTNIQEKKDISCKNMVSRLYLMPIDNKKIIISSIATTPGICDEKEKINQDNYLIIENMFSQNFHVYGVFDGHGDNGHLVSKHISDYMNDYYNNKLNYFLDEQDKQNIFTEKISDVFFKNHSEIIKSSISKLDTDLETSFDADLSQSGSTSVMLFLSNDNLICANVGDSQCFLFNCSQEDLWSFEQITSPHLASDEEEQKRIIANGGEIHPYYEQDGIYEGPDRIYAKNKVYPGLVMSRTIGDFEAKKIGVISDPDIIIKKIDNNAKFVVLGSDGLWDVVKPYDIIRIVRPFFNKGDIDGACLALMKKATQQWAKEKEERDDITFIIIFIGTPNNFIVNEKNNFLKKIEEIENDGK